MTEQVMLRAFQPSGETLNDYQKNSNELKQNAKRKNHNDIHASEFQVTLLMQRMVVFL